MLGQIFRATGASLLLALGIAAQAHAQVVDQTPLAWPSRVTGGEEVSQLSHVRSEEYTTLSHPAFPKHSVRVTRVEGFCDTTVGTYTGYVDVEAKHFFFWFFESRRNPDEDDVMLWLNGGPGGSSTLGMLMELGPCNIAGPNATAYNPHAWNNHANMIFLDQPVGVGFSYAEHGEEVRTTEEAAVDIAAFFAILSDSFPQFQSRRLHMAGESYGGRYLPLFASAVIDLNPYLEKWGMTPVNVASVMIGNGASDQISLLHSLLPTLCTGASGISPVLPISMCVRMQEATRRCLPGIQAACYDTHDTMDCEGLGSWCEAELLIPAIDLGLNPYDISRPCDGGLAETLCYPETRDIQTLLNSTYIRRLIRTDISPTEFRIASAQVADAFELSGDRLQSSTSYIGALLERGVRVLLYAGTLDMMCGAVANERTSRVVEWSGQEEFSGTAMREWEVEGKVAGEVRSMGMLTYASVYRAGHMVPHDKPVEALALVNRWIAEQEL